MPTPYSDHLRQKALEASARGERQGCVSQMFNISRNTVDLVGLKRREATGSPSASRNYQRGPSPKIENLAQFRAFGAWARQI